MFAKLSSKLGSCPIWILKNDPSFSEILMEISVRSLIGRDIFRDSFVTKEFFEHLIMSLNSSDTTVDSLRNIVSSFEQLSYKFHER